MSIARTLLSAYRKIQYKVWGRSEFGIMPAGMECSHTPFEQEINHGDVVHPCVRYVPDGYLGHKWWMVYTPYYKCNDKTENPILCYGENETDKPPKHWIVKYQVQGQPEKGYNSDPTLLYDNNKLYVMWRENSTTRCDNAGIVRGTFGAIVKENGIGEIFGPLLTTNDTEEDAEVSPTFISMKGESYKCYAMHLKFHSHTISSMRGILKKIFSSISLILDLLGIWSQQKHYGIAQWKSSSIDEKFVLFRTMKFTNCNCLYRPWHMDLFEYNKKLYAIVQSNQCNADICLAESMDGMHFRMFAKPLMTTKTCGKVGIYKPTGGIIEGILYLYYTAQDTNNRALNKLYLSSFPFEQIAN